MKAPFVPVTEQLVSIYRELEKLAPNHALAVKRLFELIAELDGDDESKVKASMDALLRIAVVLERDKLRSVIRTIETETDYAETLPPPEAAPSPLERTRRLRLHADRLPTVPRLAHCQRARRLGRRGRADPMRVLRT